MKKTLANILHYVHEGTRNRELILLSLGISVMILLTPLQHQIHLSRFQHYSFAVGAVAVGCLLQAVLAWRHVSWWGRGALVACFVYLSTFAFVCYSNPWLDWNFDLETSRQSVLRRKLAVAFPVCWLPIGFMWWRWAVDEHRQRSRRKAQQGQQAQVSS